MAEERTSENLGLGAEAGGEVDPSTPKAASVAIDAFLKIMDLWCVPYHQSMVLLGEPPIPEINLWRTGQVAMPNEILNRISEIIGIYADLQPLFDEDPAQADEWVNTPNKAFDGKTPLEHMLRGSEKDIEEVRSYLGAIVDTFTP